MRSTRSTPPTAGWPPFWIGSTSRAPIRISTAFQKALGIETRVARGPHVILFHQHSDAEADERIALLERVITGYHLLFAAQGIELTVPRRRLVSAWFADQKDYLAFLHAEDADAFATTRGYFHPTWNAVVAFDARSTEQQRTAAEQTGREARRAPTVSARWSTRRPRGAGSGSSSPTSRCERSAVPRRRR